MLVPSALSLAGVIVFELHAKALIIKNHDHGLPWSRTPHCHCKGHTFNPWLGTKIHTCCAAQPQKKNHGHIQDLVHIRHANPRPFHLS